MFTLTLKAATCVLLSLKIRALNSSTYLLDAVQMSSLI
jgi:hypothetical protein